MMFSRGSANENLVSEAVSDAVVRTDKLSALLSFWKHKPASPGANVKQTETPERAQICVSKNPATDCHATL
jgi:hypothetical protein